MQLGSLLCTIWTERFTDPAKNRVSQLRAENTTQSVTKEEVEEAFIFYNFLRWNKEPLLNVGGSTTVFKKQHVY